MLGESMRRRRHLGAPPPRRAAPAARLRWSRWIPSAIAAVLLSFGTGYGVAVQFVFPPIEEPVGDALPVPRLTGRELTAAQSEIVALGLVVGEVRWLPHPEEPAGVVVAQDPLPGQRLRSGAEVTLAVSSGRARAVVPDVVGLPYETARQLARRMGFEVNRRTEVERGPAGLVLRVEPRPGTERVLPASIALIVSTSPPVIPDSVIVPFDTRPQPRDTSPVPPLPGGGVDDAASGERFRDR